MEFVENHWTVVTRALGPDLYAGTSGIAFFLIHLFTPTRERLYRKTAEAALEQAISRADDLNPSSSFGFYAGLTGLAYVLIEGGEILENDRFVSFGFKILKRLLEENAGTQGWDVLSGCAGVIPVLLTLHARHGETYMLDLAVRHGNLLLQSAQKHDSGWSWDTLQSSGGRNLTGFSHGTAGIGWALLELWAKVGEEKFRSASEQAFNYERHWFNDEQQNWPDFRSFNKTNAGGENVGYAVAWCHGAAGIGLSRIRAYKILGDEMCRKEAEVAIRTTLRNLKSSLQSVHGNYCLCHGNAGNSELLIYASEILHDSAGLPMAYEVGEQGIRTYDQNRAPWPCGVLGGGETPTLMLGLAGVGYYYLRLRNPKQTPSILLVGPSAPVSLV